MGTLPRRGRHYKRATLFENQSLLVGMRHMNFYFEIKDEVSDVKQK